MIVIFMSKELVLYRQVYNRRLNKKDLSRGLFLSDIKKSIFLSRIIYPKRNRLFFGCTLNAACGAACMRRKQTKDER